MKEFSTGYGKEMKKRRILEETNMIKELANLYDTLNWTSEDKMIDNLQSKF